MPRNAPYTQKRPQPQSQPPMQPQNEQPARPGLGELTSAQTAVLKSLVTTVAGMAADLKAIKLVLHSTVKKGRFFHFPHPFFVFSAGGSFLSLTEVLVHYFSPLFDPNQILTIGYFPKENT